ncbi:MAG: PDZ domain-containing protein [Acidobacteria bacterium]|nr:PDZ domain-containing protein [Acidobacteriota bacterium]
MNRLALGLSIVLAGIIPAAAQTRYTIDLAHGAAGWLDVTAEADCPAPSCEWRMPVWSATYQVRDFAQHIHRIEAFDAADQGPLAIRRLGPSRWEAPGAPGRRVAVRYRIRADRPGPFGAYVDGEQLTLNLSQVLLYPAAERNRPAWLGFAHKPEGFGEALALEPADGGYRAESYDRLVDTPVLLGRFEETSFEVDGATLRVVAAGAPTRSVISELQATLRRLAKAAGQLMDGLPFERYTMIYVFSDEDGGGMEFRNGSIIFGPADCRQCALPGLTAHELFHLWNVKRIRPASMEPVRFDEPIPTPSLWFAEGVTSTYAEYLQISAGLAGPNSLPGRIERLINEYESRPATRTQSAEQAGIEAWFERYPEYGRADRSASYYLQGEIIGHLLDLEIRHATANHASLDDVMRRLNRDYAEHGRPFEDLEAIERVATEVASTDMAPTLESLVRSADPVPWERYLGYAGYRLAEEETVRADAGMTLSNAAGQGVVVAEVAVGGPAEDAGLRRGDRLLRVDGHRITGGSYDAIDRFEKLIGRRAELLIDRSGRLRTLEIAAAAHTERRWRIVSLERLTDLQRAVRSGWLNRRTAGRGGGSASE